MSTRPVGSCRIRGFALIIAKGFCMGSADIIPGVSGGTMAFILGIYARLVHAIRSFDLVWLQALARRDFREAVSRPDLAFLLSLAGGIVLALLVFTRLIPVPRLLQEYPEPVYSLFFGLILASVVYLIGRFEHRHVRDGLFLAAGTVIGWLVFTMIPVDTPDEAWFLFLAGSLSICAMILPGISGSFVLLILNQYSTVFDAIGYFRLSILIPFALGAAVGLLLFSRLLSLLLSRCYRDTMQFIIGLLIASLWVIWPFQERAYVLAGDSLKVISSTPVLPDRFDGTVQLSLALFVTGYLAVVALQSMVKRRARREA